MPSEEEAATTAAEAAAFVAAEAAAEAEEDAAAEEAFYEEAALKELQVAHAARAAGGGAAGGGGGGDGDGGAGGGRGGGGEGAMSARAMYTEGVEAEADAEEDEKEEAEEEGSEGAGVEEVEAYPTPAQAASQSEDERVARQLSFELNANQGRQRRASAPIYVPEPLKNFSHRAGAFIVDAGTKHTKLRASAPGFHVASKLRRRWNKSPPTPAAAAPPKHGLTPDWIIDAGCRVFGLAMPTAERPIIMGLLDPCTNDKRLPNIPAEKTFDKSQDGLLQCNEWKGFHVILNPAYEAQVQWRFINRAINGGAVLLHPCLTLE